MTDELLALAERCEAATGPDLAINYDIAEFVTRAHMATGKAPAYTASIDAAMTLYLRVPERVPSNPRLAAAEALRQRAEAA